MIVVPMQAQDHVQGVDDVRICNDAVRVCAERLVDLGISFLVLTESVFFGSGSLDYCAWRAAH